MKCGRPWLVRAVEGRIIETPDSESPTTMTLCVSHSTPIDSPLTGLQQPVDNPAAVCGDAKP